MTSLSEMPWFESLVNSGACQTCKLVNDYNDRLRAVLIQEIVKLRQAILLFRTLFTSHIQKIKRNKRGYPLE